MDASTRAVYETQATRWLVERGASNLDKAQALAARSAGPTVDLGSGPGFHAAVLGPPVVALDGAKAMLDLVPGIAPTALRVQADLTALPFRRGALAAAWAHHSYVHVRRSDLPLALADLHRSLRLGAPVVLRVFGGDAEGEPLADDDFPGRFFALWPEERLRTVVERAGFAIEALIAEPGSRGRPALTVTAVRGRALPDYVRAGLRVLCVGLNPSLHAADAGVAYVSGSNRFWRAAVAAGLVSRPRDPRHAVAEGVGFTDIARRPTARADELAAEEYRTGYAELDALVRWLQPGVVVFVGLAGWRAAVDRRAGPGPQDRAIGGRPAYVLPSTSGLNARTPLADLVAHLHAALALVAEQPPAPAPARQSSRAPTPGRPH
ncbi:MAG: uracil-DNA glycosylase family protein [Acidimicrobiales bacterium]